MSDPSRTAPEMTATAHLMLLDPGLFCISNAADSPPPDPATGLPAARLSLAPAPGPYGGRIVIAGFNADGWLAGRDDAALVRVSGGPAQVLVTIYHAAGTASAPPKLQILRLTEAPRPATELAAESAEVLAHVSGEGDVAGQFGAWVGERGSRRWVEGFALQPPTEIAAADLEYQAVLGRGWMSPWSEAGQFCGSRGMSLPILGLLVRLRGESAKTNRLDVSATFVDGTEAGPVAPGEPIQSPTLAALEAFRIAVVPKLPERPARTRKKLAS